MPLTQTQLKATFVKLIDAAPNKLSATIPGTSSAVDAVKTTLGREIQYSEYGVQQQYRFSIIVNKEDLDSVPDIDAIITIAGTEYRLIGSETDSSEVSIRFDLGDKYA